MREFLYQQIANIITTHCTYIEVVDTTQHRDFAILEDGKMRTIQSRMLTLRVCLTTDNYDKGQTWHISEYDMDRVVAILRKEDEKFRKRFEDESLNIKDVEAIINKASFGIVKLRLSNIEYYF